MARIISRASVRLSSDATGLAREINRAVRRASRGQRAVIEVDIDTDRFRRGLRSLSRASGQIMSTMFSGRLIRQAADAMKNYGAVIFAITPAVASLGVELAATLKVVALLPAIGMAAAAAIGALVVGMQGFGDALKNMDDVDKFNEALENLAPNAQAAARMIRSLREPFGDLRLEVQQELFDGVAGSIKNLAEANLPVLREGLKGIAGELSDGFNLWADYAASAEGVRNLETIFEGTEGALDNLGTAGRDFSAALADIAAVGATFLEPLTDTLAEQAETFRDFINEAEKTGELKEFIQEGIDAVSQLGRTLRAVGKVISTIFQGIAGEGQGFLATLEQGADSLNKFLNTAEGQDVLKSLGDLMRGVGDAVRNVFGTALSELGPVLVELTPFLVELVTTVGVFLAEAIKAVAPLLMDMARFLSENKEIMAPLAAAMLIVFKVIGILVPVVTRLITVAKFLKKHWRIIINLFKINPWVALITTVITVTILIIKNWDKIKKFLINVWNTIKAIGTVVWNNIKQTFNDTTHAIRATFFRVWNRIKDFFVNTWNAIKDKTVSAFNSVKDAVSNGVSAVVDFVSALPGKVLDFFTGLPGKMFDVGKDILQGLIDGIASIVGAVIDKAKEIGGQILGGIKSVLGIGSPSKEMAKLGEFAGQGLVKGLEKITPRVDKAAGELGATVTDAAQRRIKLTGPGGLAAGRGIGGDGATAPAASFNQTNIMQPGTDVRQFAEQVLQRGMTGYRSGGGTRAVSRKGVQAGVNDQRVEGVRT